MTTRPRVLIAEDEIIVALDIEVELEEQGFEVVGLAPRGDEAFRF